MVKSNLCDAKLLNLLLFSLSTSVCFGATINAFVDRNPVHINESFQLVFEGTTYADPDFSPLLSDFEILNNSQSSHVNIINGQQSSSKKWTLTLMAKRTGTLTIPPISFGNDNSSARSITVLPAPKSPSGQIEDIFLEVEAEPKNPYVQSQVIYTVRVFSAINLNNASLTEPSAGEIVIEKLGEDRRYETHRDGKRFVVIERKYAVFPQHSGDITIEPLTLETQIVEGKRSNPFFDDFFSRPKTRLQRVRSEAITLKVRAIPEAFKGQNWLPAKQLTLQETWLENPPRFKVGEPVTRTLTLLTAGLTAGQLPEFPKFRENNFKQYPDQPKLDQQNTPQGVISRREKKVALMPSKAGEYTLPAIQIPWWNTETDRMEFANLPARTFSVLPAKNAPTAPIVVPSTPTTITKTPLETTNFWTWLSIIFAIGWIGTLIAWWLSRRPHPPKDTQNEKAALKKVKQACHNHQATQAKEALLTWAKIHWQNYTPNSLGEIGKRCGGQVQTEIQALNHFLYSNHTVETWNGSGLWSALKTYHVQQTNLLDKKIEVGLEPLYQV